MKLGLKDWWPWYRRIIETFGYDQAKDQYAADLLSKLLAGKALDPSELRDGWQTSSFGVRRWSFP